MLSSPDSQYFSLTVHSPTTQALHSLSVDCRYVPSAIALTHPFLYIDDCTMLLRERAAYIL